jgi:hypothetical protein
MMIKFKKKQFALTKCTEHIKPNPNNFVIIKKWNNRVYNLYRHEIFKELEELIELDFYLNGINLNGIIEEKQYAQ